MGSDIEDILNECSKNADKVKRLYDVDLTESTPSGEQYHTSDSNNLFPFDDYSSDLLNSSESNLLVPIWQHNEKKLNNLLSENQKLIFKLTFYERMITLFHPARIAIVILSIILFLAGALFLIAMITGTKFDGLGLIKATIIIDSLFILMSILLLKIGVKKITK